MPPSENCGCGDRLARNEYDRHRRVFEHRRRGLTEEQLVAGAAAHAHDDEIMGAFLRFRENRVTCRHVRVDDGPYRYVTVVGHLDYISHDGLLLPTCAKGATLASVVCRAGGNVERGHRAAAGACDGDGGVGRAARYLVSRDWNDDAQRGRSEEHTSELQSRQYLVCRLLLEKKKQHTLASQQLSRC